MGDEQIFVAGEVLVDLPVLIEHMNHDALRLGLGDVRGGRGGCLGGVLALRPVAGGRHAARSHVMGLINEAVR